MSSLPSMPRIRRAALVSFDPGNPAAGVIPFQYNPAQLHRSLVPQLAPEDSGASQAQRITGPPRESISLEVELDAADLPAQPGVAGLNLGLHPQLAALELLLYPKAATVLRNVILNRLGVIEVLAPQAPLTVLVWGVKRVVPVRLVNFSVSEDAYDMDLNPSRATVSLSLEVLTYQDLPPTNLGFGLYIAHQLAKEALAAVGGTLAAVPGLATIGANPRLLLG